MQHFVCPTCITKIKTCSHCVIATAIFLMKINGLYGIQCKCSHGRVYTASQAPVQLIVSRNKSQSEIAACEWAFVNKNSC